MSSGRTKITIESYRRTIMKTRRKAITVRCEFCKSLTLLITPNQAAAVLQTTEREIFRRVEAGAFHFVETETGGLLICRNSLTALEK